MILKLQIKKLIRNMGLCPLASNKKNEHVVGLLNSNNLIFEDHENPANNSF